MRAVAILCVRNEEAYIGTALRHLIGQGLQVAVMDNESTDATWEIVSSFPRKDVIYHERLRYEGAFHLSRILNAGAVVARQLGADWILAQAADEILQSPYPGETLYDSLVRIHASGANVVNFNEFNFLPTDSTQDYRGRDFLREMLYYYFYQPRYPWLLRVYPWQMRLFRPHLADAFVAGAGHFVRGPGVRRHPVDFVLRHYIALSLPAFRQKYAGRRFAAAELARGWHHDRVNIDLEHVSLPPSTALRRLDRWDSCTLDTSDPWARHFWQCRGGRPGARPVHRIAGALGL